MDNFSVSLKTIYTQKADTQRRKLAEDIELGFPEWMLEKRRARIAEYTQLAETAVSDNFAMHFNGGYDATMIR